jgi:uncharacterized protein (DUF1778 family)
MHTLTGYRMATKKPIKKTNIMVRVSAKEKQLIQKAAALAQRAMSDYTRIHILRKAESDIAAAAKDSDTSVTVAQTD